MIIKLPVVGIPYSSWKKKAVKFSRNNPNIIQLDVEDLSYECDRHRKLLSMFDNGINNYESSSYYRHTIEKSKKTKEVAFKKINKFKILYDSMKQGIYECPKNRLPIITEDGCRLDGSHKLTILKYLGIKKTDVNVFLYRRVFSREEFKKIMKDNINFKRDKYGL